LAGEIMKVKYIALSIALSNILLATEIKQNLEPIAVTANKIEENLQDVPQSITVLNELTIKEKEIKTIEDIVQEIPNMNSIPGYNKSMNFRGLNSSMFTLNNPMVIYIDGIPYTSSETSQISMANIEKIEVLRGPQGTLYGKDAIGGVIKIATKKNLSETLGAIDIQYGSDNYKYLSYNINSPIIENKLYVGINGLIEEDDSWVNNS
jgi:iron complex outermembrane recepter protein